MGAWPSDIPSGPYEDVRNDSKAYAMIIRFRRALAFGAAAGVGLLVWAGPVGADPLPLPIPVPAPIPAPPIGIPAPVPLAAPGASGTPSQSPQQTPKAANVAPTGQIGACGNGAGVLGQGTSTKSCSGSKGVTVGGGGGSSARALLKVSPTVQAGVCGNRAGVLGTCTNSDCSGPPSKATACGGSKR